MKIEDSGINKVVLKFTISLLCIALVIGFVTYARNVVIPFVMAVLFGVLLRPIEKFFHLKLRIPRVLAIVITLLLFLLLIGSIIFLLLHELGLFTRDLSVLNKNLTAHLQDLMIWANTDLHIDYANQGKYVDTLSQHSVDNISLPRTLANVTELLVNIILVPVFLFLVMYYRNLLLLFALNSFGAKNKALMANIVIDIKVMLQGYISGLFLEMVVVAILQTVAMYIVGVKYALLIGLVTAILNLVPYLGILTAFLFSVIVSLATTSDIGQMFYMFIGFLVVHFVDNTILIPNLIGSRLRINALFSILGIFTGGLICGIPGMFLSIPFMAVQRIVFNHIDHLKPWGRLLGDEIPKEVKWHHEFPSQ